MLEFIRCYLLNFHTSKNQFAIIISRVYRQEDSRECAEDEGEEEEDDYYEATGQMASSKRNRLSTS